MAAYINHAQMAFDTYEKLEQEKLLEVNVDRKLMTSFAPAIDLSNHNHLTHNTNTQDFLLYFIYKIKQEKQIDDPNIMAMLYGHICHYFLDTIIHPYVYYIERGTKKVKGQILSPHTIVEGYLSAYFINKGLNKSIQDVKVDHYFKLPPKECKELLDNVYKKIYNLDNISREYKKLLMLIIFSETILKNTPLRSEKLCKSIIRFQKYLKENDLTKKEIANEDHMAWCNPVTGEESTSSAQDLYFKSIDNAVEAIHAANGYLYKDHSLDYLKTFFPNLSYDTGVDLSLDQEMHFCRKRV